MRPTLRTCSDISRECEHFLSPPFSFKVSVCACCLRYVASVWTMSTLWPRKTSASRLSDEGYVISSNGVPYLQIAGLVREEERRKGWERSVLYYGKVQRFGRKRTTIFGLFWKPQFELCEIYSTVPCYVGDAFGARLTGLYWLGSWDPEPVCPYLTVEIRNPATFLDQPLNWFTVVQSSIFQKYEWYEG